MSAALVLLDTETTGLDVEHVLMLEVGMVVVSEDWEVIDSWSSLVGGSHPELLREVHKLEAIAAAPGRYEGAMTTKEIENAVWVLRQHRESGLWERYTEQLNADALPTPEKVAQAGMKFMLRHNADGLPMSGSNVANFDRPMVRRILPSLEEIFHYRNIDISSVREFVRFADPDRAAEIEDLMRPKALHRVVPDCLDTLEMFRHYSKELIKS